MLPKKKEKGIMSKIMIMLTIIVSNVSSFIKPGEKGLKNFGSL